MIKEVDNLVIEAAEEVDYEQYSQESSIRFSLVYKEGDNLYVEKFYPVLCKETFSHAIAYEQLEFHQDYNINSLSYINFIDTPNSLKGTLALKIDLDKYVDITHFRNNIKILDELAERLDLSPFNILTGDYEDRQAFIIELDHLWLKSSVTASLLTSILRYMTYQKYSNLVDLLTNSDHENYFNNLGQLNHLIGCSYTEILKIVLESARDTSIIGENWIPDVRDCNNFTTFMPIKGYSIYSYFIYGFATLLQTINHNLKYPNNSFGTTFCAQRKLIVSKLMEIKNAKSKKAEDLLAA